MLPHSPTHSVDRVAFERALLRFVNDVLPTLDRRGRTWSPVDAGTPLFESGLLDSLSILHLIAEVDRLTGCPVPDHLVLMKHFRTVQAITATFHAPSAI